MIRDRKPLAYWLDPQLSAADAQTEGVLRVMASNYAQRRATVAVMLALAAAGLVAAGVLTVAGAAGGGAGTALGAIALAAGAALLRRRWAQRVLDTRPVPASRAPQTLGRAWGLWGGAGALLAAVALVEAFKGTPPTSGFVVFAVAVMGVLAIVLFIPAWHAQHERDAFRALLASRPDLRAELERMAAAWDDPRRPFGPL